jgi:hypothetical protein
MVPTILSARAPRRGVDGADVIAAAVRLVERRVCQFAKATRRFPFVHGVAFKVEAAKAA